MAGRTLKNKKGLGRGFESLIPSQVLDENFDPSRQQDERVSELRQIDLSQIQVNPDQPRRHFDEQALAELADSIKQHGVLQPIVVTPHRGTFQIVAGERRFRAAKAAGLKRIPALVRTLSDQHKLELSLIENIQRRDLNPLETATAYLKLHQQFNLTYEEIGRQVGGKAISTISNALRLLQLPPDAKQALVSGQISEGHARQILALSGDAAGQRYLLKNLLAENWSVRRAERYVVARKQGADSERPLSERPKKDYGAAERAAVERLQTVLKAPVQLKNGRGSEKGYLTIGFRGAQDLKRILTALLGARLK